VEVEVEGKIVELMNSGMRITNAVCGEAVHPLHLPPLGALTVHPVIGIGVRSKVVAFLGTLLLLDPLHLNAQKDGNGILS